MAIASAALAYRRSAYMTTGDNKPLEEILAARDDFHAFCKAMGKPPAKHAGVACRAMWELIVNVY